MSRAARWSPGRSAALLLLLLAALLSVGVVTASPASAHATLVSTDPGEGARLPSVPGEVSLQFSEGVSLGAGYLRVLDSGGGRVDTGTAEADGSTVRVGLRSGLGEGGYLVTYRVVSADSHPISGTFSFAVGEGSLVDAAVAGAGDDTDPGVAVALPTGRWLGFAGLALAVGVPVLAALCWPGGWASPLLRRLTAAGLAALAAGAVLTFLAQGPYAAATGLGSAADPDLLAATLDSELGVALLVRLALTAALALVLLPWLRRGEAPHRRTLVLGGVLAAGIVLSTAAVGHPIAGPYPAIAVLAATAHVVAMTVWLGGLVGLLAGLLRDGVPPAAMAGALPRFSRLAAASVTVLVVSGVVQAVREVGSPDALFSTGYGRLLLAKLVLVLLALAAAGVSRVWVQQRLGVRPRRVARRGRVTAHAFAAGEAPAPEVVRAAAAREEGLAVAAAAERGALRRSVLVELGLAAAVLAVSALLVGTPPARATASNPVDVTLPLQSAAGESGSVQISLVPAAPGPNTLHVYLFDESGQLTQPDDIRVTLTEPAQEIGPIAVDLQPAGPGHYIGDDTVVPTAGTWTLSVSVRLDEFTATTASTEFPVRWSAARPIPRRTMSSPRPFARLGVVVLAVLTALAASVAVAGSAAAHVTVSSPDAAPGGFATLTFRVPTESDTASTVALRVQLPTETPLLSVSTRPVPGWSVTATRSQLPEPGDVEGTRVTAYISQLEWRADEGAGIAPGQFQEFAIAVGPLPDAGTLVLPAVQTYSDGTESAWIEPTVEGQDAPERPAPVLTIAAGGGDGASGGEPRAQDGDGDGGSTLALVVAVLALLTGVTGIVLGYRAGRRTVSS